MYLHQNIRELLIHAVGHSLEAAELLEGIG